MSEGKCIACKVATLLLIVGALNWGAIAFFQTDLVIRLFGLDSPVPRIVYGVVGVAGVLKLLNLFGLKCPTCKGSCGSK